jgi:hypothetical protein
MASGYAWEAQPLAQLPATPFWNLGASSPTQIIVHALLFGAFALYTYRYWSKGFDLARRIRIIGDALVELLRQLDTAPLSLEKAKEHLGSLGWSIDAKQSASWFLGLINARIMVKNETYQRLTPRQYGLFRMTGEVMAATFLAALHPVVAGLYIASEAKKLNELSSRYRLYNFHIARLPEQFRASLRFIHGA